MTTKDHLHQLIDKLPEHELTAAQRYLEFLSERGTDPLAGYPRSLREAPIDDEPVTDEDLAALDEAEAEFASGQGIPHAEARQRLLARG